MECRWSEIWGSEDYSTSSDSLTPSLKPIIHYAIFSCFFFSVSFFFFRSGGVGGGCIRSEHAGVFTMDDLILSNKTITF